jgi:hypothetical protein
MTSARTNAWITDFILLWIIAGGQRQSFAPASTWSFIRWWTWLKNATVWR